MIGKCELCNKDKRVLHRASAGSSEIFQCLKCAEERYKIRQMFRENLRSKGITYTPYLGHFKKRHDKKFIGLCISKVLFKIFSSRFFS